LIFTKKVGNTIGKIVIGLIDPDRKNKTRLEKCQKESKQNILEF